MRLAASLLLLLIALLVALPAAVSAQVAPTVVDGGVENRFPQGMIFRMSAESDSPIEEVRLRYTVLPDGTAASAVPDFQPGTSITASYTLEGNNPPQIYLPPGTIIEYRWQVTDADGDTTTTELKTFFYEDIRFSWRTVEGDGVVIYHYSGSQESARSMLEVARETLDSMSQLLGTSIDFPVKVWIYASPDDMRPALARRSETYERAVLTAGVRVSSDTVLVLGNVSYTTLRHELTHVVTSAAGEGPFGHLPAWLDEGTAVYGQGDPGGYRRALERALERGNVFSVRSISSSPGDPKKVDLFYGQSWSLVSFLIDTYGEEKFAQLFAAIKGGKTTDDALLAVYGFDQDGLEDRWRASLGLPPRQTPESGGDAQAQPSPSPSIGGAAGQGEEGAPVGTMVGLAVAAIALVGAVGLTGALLVRRMR